VSVEYPDLADYLAIAAAVTGVDLKTLLNATKLDLAAAAGEWDEERTAAWLRKHLEPPRSAPTS